MTRRTPLDSSPALLVFCLGTLVAGRHAAAQAPTESSATWTGPDTVTITAVVQAPDACYAAGSTAPGWPASAVKVEQALPVTFSLSRFGEMCAQVIKPVTFSMTTTVPANAQAIVIYLVNSHTKQVTLRAVALPPKPGSGSKVGPPSLQAVQWRLTHLGGQPLSADQIGKPATIMLGREAPLRFSGSTGCNSMSGTYTLNGPSLRFGRAAATKMACARGMEIERGFLAALDSVTSWRLVGRSLELLDEKNAVVARFEAAGGGASVAAYVFNTK
jgi:heat shock protein HslJ